MDFLSTVKAEVEKKRKALEATTAILGDEGPKSKKYMSRRDLERIREQQYREEQELLENGRQAKQKQKSRMNELLEQEKAEKSASDSEGHNTEDESTELFNISPEEITRRLRAKGHPIRLFGETDKQRKIRLRALELMEERTDSSGQRNDFMRTLEDLESGLDLEALKKKAGVGDDKKVKKLKDKQESLLATPIELELLQADPDKLYPLIYAFLKRILREWEENLDERPDEVKRSVQGKRTAATMKQTADYLKPLFRHLKSKDLEPDILARITEITHNMQQRLYLKAQDAYLRLSIGNSPWPIGVTMVGIHERSAREKIFAAQVAHVLNDETTRKWIQSLKRLMSFCQDKYPPDTLAQRIG